MIVTSRMKASVLKKKAIYNVPIDLLSQPAQTGGIIFILPRKNLDKQKKINMFQ